MPRFYKKEDDVSFEVRDERDETLNGLYRYEWRDEVGSDGVEKKVVGLFRYNKWIFSGTGVKKEEVTGARLNRVEEVPLKKGSWNGSTLVERQRDPSRFAWHDVHKVAATAPKPKPKPKPKTPPEASRRSGVFGGSSSHAPGAVYHGPDITVDTGLKSGDEISSQAIKTASAALTRKLPETPPRPPHDGKASPTPGSTSRSSVRSVDDKESFVKKVRQISINGGYIASTARVGSEVGCVRYKAVMDLVGDGLERNEDGLYNYNKSNKFWIIQEFSPSGFKYLVTEAGVVVQFRENIGEALGKLPLLSNRVKGEVNDDERFLGFRILNSKVISEEGLRQQYQEFFAVCGKYLKLSDPGRFDFGDFLFLDSGREGEWIIFKAKDNNEEFLVTKDGVLRKNDHGIFEPIAFDLFIKFYESNNFKLLEKNLDSAIEAQRKRLKEDVALSFYRTRNCNLLAEWLKSCEVSGYLNILTQVLTGREQNIAKRLTVTVDNKYRDGGIVFLIHDHNSSGRKQFTFKSAFGVNDELLDLAAKALFDLVEESKKELGGEFLQGSEVNSELISKLEAARSKGESLRKFVPYFWNAIKKVDAGMSIDDKAKVLSAVARINNIMGGAAHSSSFEIGCDWNFVVADMLKMLAGEEITKDLVDAVERVEGDVDSIKKMLANACSTLVISCSNDTLRERIGLPSQSLDLVNDDIPIRRVPGGISGSEQSGDFREEEGKEVAENKLAEEDGKAIEDGDASGGDDGSGDGEYHGDDAAASEVEDYEDIKKELSNKCRVLYQLMAEGNAVDGNSVNFKKEGNHIIVSKNNGVGVQVDCSDEGDGSVVSIGSDEVSLDDLRLFISGFEVAKEAWNGVLAGIIGGQKIGRGYFARKKLREQQIIDNCRKVLDLHLSARFSPGEVDGSEVIVRYENLGRVGNTAFVTIRGNPDFTVKFVNYDDPGKISPEFNFEPRNKSVIDGSYIKKCQKAQRFISDHKELVEKKLAEKEAEKRRKRENLREKSKRIFELLEEIQDADCLKEEGVEFKDDRFELKMKDEDGKYFIARDSLFEAYEDDGLEECELSEEDAENLLTICSNISHRYREYKQLEDGIVAEFRKVFEQNNPGSGKICEGVSNERDNNMVSNTETIAVRVGAMTIKVIFENVGSSYSPGHIIHGRKHLSPETFEFFRKKCEEAVKAAELLRKKELERNNAIEKEKQEQKDRIRDLLIEMRGLLRADQEPYIVEDEYGEKKLVKMDGNVVHFKVLDCDDAESFAASLAENNDLKLNDDADLGLGDQGCEELLEKLREKKRTELFEEQRLREEREEALRIQLERERLEAERRARIRGFSEVIVQEAVEAAVKKVEETRVKSKIIYSLSRLRYMLNDKVFERSGGNDNRDFYEFSYNGVTFIFDNSKNIREVGEIRVAIKGGQSVIELTTNRNFGVEGSQFLRTETGLQLYEEGCGEFLSIVEKKRQELIDSQKASIARSCHVLCPIIERERQFIADNAEIKFIRDEAGVKILMMLQRGPDVPNPRILIKLFDYDPEQNLDEIGYEVSAEDSGQEIHVDWGFYESKCQVARERYEKMTRSIEDDRKEVMHDLKARLGRRNIELAEIEGRRRAAESLKRQNEERLAAEKEMENKRRQEAEDATRREEERQLKQEQEAAKREEAARQREAAEAARQEKNAGLAKAREETKKAADKRKYDERAAAEAFAARAGRRMLAESMKGIVKDLIDSAVDKSQAAKRREIEARVAAARLAGEERRRAEELRKKEESDAAARAAEAAKKATPSLAAEIFGILTEIYESEGTYGPSSTTGAKYLQSLKITRIESADGKMTFKAEARGGNKAHSISPDAILMFGGYNAESLRKVYETVKNNFYKLLQDEPRRKKEAKEAEKKAKSDTEELNRRNKEYRRAQEDAAKAERENLKNKKRDAKAAAEAQAAEERAREEAEAQKERERKIQNNIEAGKLASARAAEQKKQATELSGMASAEAETRQIEAQIKAAEEAAAAEAIRQEEKRLLDERLRKVREVFDVISRSYHGGKELPSGNYKAADYFKSCGITYNQTTNTFEDEGQDLGNGSLGAASISSQEIKISKKGVSHDASDDELNSLKVRYKRIAAEFDEKIAEELESKRLDEEKRAVEEQKAIELKRKEAEKLREKLDTNWFKLGEDLAKAEEERRLLEDIRRKEEENKRNLDNWQAAWSEMELEEESDIAKENVSAELARIAKENAEAEAARIVREKLAREEEARRVEEARALAEAERAREKIAQEAQRKAEELYNLLKEAYDKSPEELKKEGFTSVDNGENFIVILKGYTFKISAKEITKTGVSEIAVDVEALLSAKCNEANLLVLDAVKKAKDEKLREKKADTRRGNDVKKGQENPSPKEQEIAAADARRSAAVERSQKEREHQEQLKRMLQHQEKVGRIYNLLTQANDVANSFGRDGALLSSKGIVLSGENFIFTDADGKNYTISETAITSGEDGLEEVGESLDVVIARCETISSRVIQQVAREKEDKNRRKKEERDRILREKSEMQDKLDRELKEKRKRPFAILNRIYQSEKIGASGYSAKEFLEDNGVEFKDGFFRYTVGRKTYDIKTETTETTEKLDYLIGQCEEIERAFDAIQAESEADKQKRAETEAAKKANEEKARVAKAERALKKRAVAEANDKKVSEFRKRHLESGYFNQWRDFSNTRKEERRKAGERADAISGIFGNLSSVCGVDIGQEFLGGAGIKIAEGDSFSFEYRGNQYLISAENVKDSDGNECDARTLFYIIEEVDSIVDNFISQTSSEIFDMLSDAYDDGNMGEYLESQDVKFEELRDDGYFEMDVVIGEKKKYRVYKSEITDEDGNKCNDPHVLDLIFKRAENLMDRKEKIYSFVSDKERKGLESSFSRWKERVRQQKALQDLQDKHNKSLLTRPFDALKLHAEERKKELLAQGQAQGHYNSSLLRKSFGNLRRYQQDSRLLKDKLEGVFWQLSNARDIFSDYSYNIPKITFKEDGNVFEFKYDDEKTYTISSTAVTDESGEELQFSVEERVLGDISGLIERYLNHLKQREIPKIFKILSEIADARGGKEFLRKNGVVFNEEGSYFESELKRGEKCHVYADKLTNSNGEDIDLVIGLKSFVGGLEYSFQEEVRKNETDKGAEVVRKADEAMADLIESMRISEEIGAGARSEIESWKQQRSAVKIQSFFKSLKEQKQLKQKNAVAIQSAFRGFSERKKMKQKVFENWANPTNWVGEVNIEEKIKTICGSSPQALKQLLLISSGLLGLVDSISFVKKENGKYCDDQIGENPDGSKKALARAANLFRLFSGDKKSHDGSASELLEETYLPKSLNGEIDWDNAQIFTRVIKSGGGFDIEKTKDLNKQIVANIVNLYKYETDQSQLERLEIYFRILPYLINSGGVLDEALDQVEVDGGSVDDFYSDLGKIGIPESVVNARFKEFYELTNTFFKQLNRDVFKISGFENGLSDLRGELNSLFEHNDEAAASGEAAPSRRGVRPLSVESFKAVYTSHTPL